MNTLYQHNISLWKRYPWTFGADKTKVTVTGSAHDINYYKNILFWTLGGDYLTVSENNGHLGLIVSDKNLIRILSQPETPCLRYWALHSHTIVS